MPTNAESIAGGGRVVGHDPLEREPIEVVAYDPNWPVAFEQWRVRLAAALGDVAVRIDHVGSTAVPGLAAKPVIDIQISVPDVGDAAAYSVAIENEGFELRWFEPGHRYFRPPRGLPRLAQVHVCTVGSDWERKHLLFRDYLRAHPDAAHEYGALKKRLAAQYRWDRIGYTDAKAPFIDPTVALAEEWAVRTGWRP